MGPVYKKVPPLSVTRSRSAPQEKSLTRGVRLFLRVYPGRRAPRCAPCLQGIGAAPAGRRGAVTGVQGAKAPGPAGTHAGATPAAQRKGPHRRRCRQSAHSALWASHHAGKSGSFGERVGLTAGAIIAVAVFFINGEMQRVSGDTPKYRNFNKVPLSSVQ